jgi:hypothetical protein
VAEQFTEGLLDRTSRQYQTWAHHGLAILGQKSVDRQQERAIAAFERLLTFEQIGAAKGFLAELLLDIEIVGRHTQSQAWQRAYALIQSLL